MGYFSHDAGSIDPYKIPGSIPWLYQRGRGSLALYRRPDADAGRGRHALGLSPLPIAADNVLLFLA